MSRALLALPLALAVAGCATTTVESTWSNPKLSETKLKKVVVFGIARNPSARIEFEKALTNALKDAHLVVLPGYDFVTYDEKPGREVVIERIKAAGADAALVSRVVNIHQPDSRGPVWVGGMYTPVPGGWYGYYTTYAWMPAGVRVDEGPATYDVETVLYALEDETPMWAARSSSRETSPKRLARAISDAVADAFVERNIATGR